jgi:hypothetical protein
MRQYRLSRKIDLSQWTGAIFSEDEDREYRYALWRRFRFPGDRFLNALMLNPSKATESIGDPTVNRCIKRALRLGYDGLIVTNLYALRSTNPRMLKTHTEPAGFANPSYILEAAELSETILCAWGNNADIDHADWILNMLLDCKQGSKLYCLAETVKGQPAHPLYYTYAAELKPYNPKGISKKEEDA